MCVIAPPPPAAYIKYGMLVKAQIDETIAAEQCEIEKIKEQYRREIDEERKVKNKEISELMEHISELEQRLMISEKDEVRGHRQSILPSSQGTEGKISIKLK